MTITFASHPRRRWPLLAAGALMVWGWGMPLGAQTEEPPPPIELPTTAEAKAKLSGREVRILRRQMKGREDEATAAFKNAETAFLVGEYDKAIEEFLGVSREYEDTSFRMRAVLRIGDVYYRQKKYERAVSYYQRSLKVPSEVWWPEDTIEQYARADYMIGVSHFDQNGYDRAFAHFRGFVRRYPASKFVDRAYDFIGRGNMARKRYGQAIEAFRMVGTATIAKDGRRTISPGEDLYIRVGDPDVGLAAKGATATIRLTTTSGDEELVELASLGLGSPTFLGMIKTRLGAPRLTRALDEALTAEHRATIAQWLKTADTMDTEIAQVKGQIAQLVTVVNAAKAEARAAKPADPQTPAQPTPQETELKQARDRLATLLASQLELRRRAYARIDTAFASIEKVLAGWNVAKIDPDKPETPGSEVTTAERDDSGDAEEEQPDAIGDVFSEKQVNEARETAKAEPTNAANQAQRLALLTYWHADLIREFKTLDLTGSDTVTVAYVDLHGETEDGTARSDTLGIAADARIACVGPDLKTIINAVILGDEVRVKVVDYDMDRSPGPDTIEVVIARVVRTPEAEEPAAETSDEEEAAAEGAAEEDALSVAVFEPEEEVEVKPVLLPEGVPNMTLKLTETGPHTGDFRGSFATLSADAESPVAKLALSPEHEIRIAYQDAKVKSRDGDWVVVTTLGIVPGAAGEQEVIEMQESKLDRRSELKKGVALGKLARVYQDLGLTAESRRTFDEALKVVKKVVDAEGDSPLGEEATYQMWDLYFASGDEAAAAEACAKLIAAFPNSPLADDALLIMGKAERERPQDAVSHFSRLVQRYPDSALAPEAQYLIAELKAQMDTFDVVAFETCANKYPDSNFAAKSLLALAEYYMEGRDYARANDYLERVTLDFPDFDRLDKTTYMRGICAYRRGDVHLANSLMHEVVEKYPGSAVAKSAGKIIQVLVKKLAK